MTNRKKPYYNLINLREANNLKQNKLKIKIKKQAESQY